MERRRRPRSQTSNTPRRRHGSLPSHVLLTLHLVEQGPDAVQEGEGNADQDVEVPVIETKRDVPDGRSQSGEDEDYRRSLPVRFGTAGFSTELGRLSGGLLGPAGRAPVTHALHVFFCVVAVSIAVAQGGSEVTSRLAFPQPLDGDTELASSLRDPVGGAPVLFHISKILGARLFRYRN